MTRIFDFQHFFFAGWKTKKINIFCAENFVILYSPNRKTLEDSAFVKSLKITCISFKHHYFFLLKDRNFSKLNKIRNIERNIVLILIKK